MPVITLPDGAQKTFDEPVTVGEVAQSIGAGLAKSALAGAIGDKLVDLTHVLDVDVALRIITDRDDEGVDMIRHSTAHLMAQAVKRLFPETQVTIGPVIENGFFYDFARVESFRPEDLEAIETEMARIVKEDFAIERDVMGRDEAEAFFRSIGEDYKAEIIASIPESETLSIYRQGPLS
jgi:threonyl-tRNA synthetase